MNELSLPKDQLFKSQYTRAKFDKIQSFPDSYRSGGKPNINIYAFKIQYENLPENKANNSVELSLSGRVKLIRKTGKIVFMTIEDFSGKLQLVLSLDSTESYQDVKNLFHAGDIIHAIGYPYRTNTGELSLRVTNIKMLTKSLNDPIGKHDGVKNEELLMRHPELGMMTNPDNINKLLIRSKVINIIRDSMISNRFIEVETPILNAIPGGANAAPFETYHNALDSKRYLRIAPELYLKRLLVGGFEKVFEIGKNFRNEGIDATHNPEFTVIEFYEAYATYEEHMSFIQMILQTIVQSLKIDNSKFKVISSKTGEEIDLSIFRKITFRNSLVYIGGIDEDIIDSFERLREFLVNQPNIDGEKVQNQEDLGGLWTIAFDEFVEDKLIQPRFITDYPKSISPLARTSDDDSEIAERFELFIDGKEIANGFNELTNPIEQYKNFLSQVEKKESDDEAMFMDKDYIKSLMYALPPCAGVGIGIDRLVMMFTNSKSIKDVIAFPAIKGDK